MEETLRTALDDAAAEAVVAQAMAVAVAVAEERAAAEERVQLAVAEAESGFLEKEAKARDDAVAEAVEQALKESSQAIEAESLAVASERYAVRGLLPGVMQPVTRTQLHLHLQQ